jgi:hypothetical protein
MSKDQGTRKPLTESTLATETCDPLIKVSRASQGIFSQTGCRQWRSNEVSVHGSRKRERKTVMGLDHVRSELEHMRAQVGRQRREILLLQRAGIDTASAETLLQRMLAKIDSLVAERDRLKALEPKAVAKSKVLGGRS